MKPNNIINFLQLAVKLKTVPRTGWVESGVENSESVADHSFLTALTAMLLSDSSGLDTCKVMRMALLHDLAEAKTGDIIPNQKKTDHKELENRAMKKILSILEEPMKAHYWETWVEYQKNETLEAELVHDSDKIEMVLQALEYMNILNNRKLNCFIHTQVSPTHQEILDLIKMRKKII